MTEIDFYILTGESNEQRLTVACRLAEKAIKQNQTLFIHTENQQMSEELDSALWAFRDESFIPHKIIDDKQALSSVEPVIIAHDVEPDGARTILINLAPEAPVFFGRFIRTLEIINSEPAVKENGRQRWAFYKSHGYPLKHHTL